MSSGLVSAAVAAAVIVLVAVRQFTPSARGSDRRAWLLPVVLIGISLFGGKGLLDPRHHALSLVLEAAGIAVSLAGGVLWGATVRVWRDGSGTVWSKAGAVSLGVWVAAVAARAVIYLIGDGLGVHQPSGALTLALGVMLLTRTAVVALRQPAAGPSGASAPSGAA